MAGCAVRKKGKGRGRFLLRKAVRVAVRPAAVSGRLVRVAVRAAVRPVRLAVRPAAVAARAAVRPAAAPFACLLYVHWNLRRMVMADGSVTKRLVLGAGRVLRNFG